MDVNVLRGYGGCGFGRDHQALHHRVPGEVSRCVSGVAFIPPPGTGWDFPLLIVKFHIILLIPSSSFAFPAWRTSSSSVFCS